jgi:hypothetical protein
MKWELPAWGNMADAGSHTAATGSAWERYWRPVFFWGTVSKFRREQ